MIIALTCYLGAVALMTGVEAYLRRRLKDQLREMELEIVALRTQLAMEAARAMVSEERAKRLSDKFDRQVLVMNDMERVFEARLARAERYAQEWMQRYEALDHHLETDDEVPI